MILTAARTDEVIGATDKWLKYPATWGEITKEDGKPVSDERGPEALGAAHPADGCPAQHASGR